MTTINADLELLAVKAEQGWPTQFGTAITCSFEHVTIHLHGHQYCMQVFAGTAYCIMDGYASDVMSEAILASCVAANGRLCLIRLRCAQLSRGASSGGVDCRYDSA